jgi:glycosyltransferase 2 family protein
VATAGPIDAGSARTIFFVSQLGKYLPGAVWTVLAQVDAARRHGLSRTGMGIGAVLFLVFHVLTALLAAALLLPWGAPQLLGAYWWSFALTPLLLVAFVPAVLSRLVTLAARITRRRPMALDLQVRDVAVAVAWLVLVWLAYGAAMYVLVRPLAPETPAVALAVLGTGAFALAWAVGVLVLPAPAGVGPRELVLFVALSPVIGPTAATSIAVVTRVVHTLGDLALAGVHLRRLHV